MIYSGTSESQVLSSNMETWKNSVQELHTSKAGAAALFQTGDAAASVFSRKQEIRKSRIN